jgi:hypothetical protein
MPLICPSRVLSAELEAFIDHLKAHLEPVVFKQIIMRLTG